MKKLLITLLASFVLVGCGTTTVIKKEIVTVDKPVPFVPKPPDVPKFESQIDKLVPADVADPGKVGQAYKYDVTYLRQLVKIHEMILDQYRQSSQDFDKVNAEITKLFEQVNKAEAAAVDKIAK